MLFFGVVKYKYTSKIIVKWIIFQLGATKNSYPKTEEQTS